MRVASFSLGVSAVMSTGCVGAIPRASSASLSSTLSVVAEGPCPKLEVAALGSRRILVFGDDGYELESWLPGERLAATESLAEIDERGAFRRLSLLAGLPSDSRGYAPFDLEIGGAFEHRAWLLLVTTRYRPHGQGALFERSSDGFIFGGDRWTRSEEESPVDLPREASHLPPLPISTVCATVGLTFDEKMRFVPLASAKTPSGGVFVAGRCSDDGITNVQNPPILIAHGAPKSSRWTVDKTPETESLDGIVNISMTALSDEDASLVAYEPFKESSERKAYLSHYDGRSWQRIETHIDDGLMDVAKDRDGSLYLAAGRALYHRNADGQTSKMPLPELRYVGDAPADAPSPTRPNDKRETGLLHVRRVEILGEGELWVGASYRVETTGSDGKSRSMRASALLSTVAFPRPLYCDVRESADAALTEIEGAH